MCELQPAWSVPNCHHQWCRDGGGWRYGQQGEHRLPLSLSHLHRWWRRLRGAPQRHQDGWREHSKMAWTLLVPLEGKCVVILWGLSMLSIDYWKGRYIPDVDLNWSLEGCHGEDTCERGFAVTPCILCWESDGGPAWRFDKFVHPEDDKYKYSSTSLIRPPFIRISLLSGRDLAVIFFFVCTIITGKRGISNSIRIPTQTHMNYILFPT